MSLKEKLDKAIASANYHLDTLLELREQYLREIMPPKGVTIYHEEGCHAQGRTPYGCYCGRTTSDYFVRGYVLPDGRMET